MLSIVIFPLLSPTRMLRPFLQMLHQIPHPRPTVRVLAHLWTRLRMECTVHIDAEVVCVEDGGEREYEAQQEDCSEEAPFQIASLHVQLVASFESIIGICCVDQHRVNLCLWNQYAACRDHIRLASEDRYWPYIVPVPETRRCTVWIVEHFLAPGRHEIFAGLVLCAYLYLAPSGRANLQLRLFHQISAYPPVGENNVELAVGDASDTIPCLGPASHTVPDRVQEEVEEEGDSETNLGRACQSKLVVYAERRQQYQEFYRVSHYGLSSGSCEYLARVLRQIFSNAPISRRFWKARICSRRWTNRCARTGFSSLLILPEDSRGFRLL